MSADTIRVLLNPVSGRGKANRSLERIRTLLEAESVEVLVPGSVDEFRDLCRRSVAEGVRRLGVAGGDGTLHHAAQVLAGSSCALGILPLGSCNDLASALGIGDNLERAAHRLVHGSIRRIDLGAAGDRVYAGVGGVGFDGEVARMVNEEVRWLPGPVAFPYAAVRTLFRFRPPEVVIEHDGGRFRGRVYFAVLANSPRFGGGMHIAPQASLEDGLLDLVIVHRVSRLTLLRCMPLVYSGRHIGHPAVTALQTREASVSCDRTLTIYGDGEPLLPVGEEPVRFRALPATLSVIA